MAEAAFIQLVQQHHGLIYKVTRVYAVDSHDAEDLYQEIVYQLWKSFGTFRNEAKPGTWIYRVALNTAIAHLNNRTKRGRIIPVDNTALPDRGQDEKADNSQSEMLFALIKQLSEVEKGIILLYLEGKSYAEIAAITGFSVTNTGTRLGRIKQKLASQINQKK